MDAAKYSIRGSDFIGAFATATDKFLFIGGNESQRCKDFITEMLAVRGVELSVGGSEFTGLLARANSNGILLSNLALDEEVAKLKHSGLGINIAVLESSLNAVGCNILANDKVALVNSEYDHAAMRQISDVLGVEVFQVRVDGFKTVGANNILTNTGLVVNNRCTDSEKAHLEKLSGFSSERTTANTGSLHLGLSVIANSRAVIAGDSTTGYELARIVDGLEQ